MKFFVGLVDAQPNAPEIQELEISDIARPREILDALRWQEGTLRQAGKSATARNDVLEFDLPPRAGKALTGRLQFDPQSGAVASLQFHNADAELISEVFYADWQPLSDVGGGASQGCFATPRAFDAADGGRSAGFSISRIDVEPANSASEFSSESRARHACGKAEPDGNGKRALSR